MPLILVQVRIFWEMFDYGSSWAICQFEIFLLIISEPVIYQLLTYSFVFRSGVVVVAGWMHG